MSEPVILESNQNHAMAKEDGISPSLPASMGMGGGYVPMITVYSANKATFFTGAETDIAGTLVATDYKDPPLVAMETDEIVTLSDEFVEMLP